MLAAYLNGAGNIECRDDPVPDISAGQVLVRVESVGVCGSDVHYYRHGRVGPFVASEPLILGHESAGEVVRVGRDVTSLKEGARVALEPGVPCRRCPACKRGRYNLCTRVTFMGSAPREHGAFREYVAYDADFAYPLPNGMSSDEGALLEPLAAALYALRRGGVKPGDRVAVLGAGPIVLLVAQVDVRAGAIQTIVSDLSPHRLSLARRLGATHTVDARSESVAEVVGELTGGAGVDVAVEAVGARETHQDAVTVASRGGTVVFVGWAVARQIPIDVHAIGVKELTVKGMFRYCNVYPEAILLVAGGAVDLKSLVTHRFRLAQLESALRVASERGEGTVKVIVNTQ